MKSGSYRIENGGAGRVIERRRRADAQTIVVWKQGAGESLERECLGNRKENVWGREVVFMTV